MKPLNTELKELNVEDYNFEKNISDGIYGRNYFAGLELELKKKLQKKYEKRSELSCQDFKQRFENFFDEIKAQLILSNWEDVERIVNKWKTKEIVINSLLLEIFLRVDQNILGKVFSSLLSSGTVVEPLSLVQIKEFDPKDQYKFVSDIILRGSSNLYLIELKCGSKYPVDQYVKNLRIYNAFKWDSNKDIKYILVSIKGFEKVSVLTRAKEWVEECDTSRSCKINPTEYKNVIRSYKKKEFWKEYVNKEEFSNCSEFPIYFRSYNEILEAFKKTISSERTSEHKFSNAISDLEFTIGLIS